MPYSRMTAINYRHDGYQERFAAQFTKPMRRHPEWRYYKDGKSWLCKITQKNKNNCLDFTLGTFFKSRFYFTEKSRSGLESLNIDTRIKASFSKTKPIRKLIPVILDLENVARLENFKKINNYKLSLK